MSHIQIQEFHYRINFWYEQGYYDTDKLNEYLDYVHMMPAHFENGKKMWRLQNLS